MSKWCGEVPTNCDICRGLIGKAFIDGKTVMGPWANMCESCHALHGVGLGTGRGQKFCAKTRDKLNG